MYKRYTFSKNPPSEVRAEALDFFSIEKSNEKKNLHYLTGCIKRKFFD